MNNLSTEQIIEHIILNTHVFMDTIHELIPEIEKENIVVNLSESDIVLFKNKTNVQKKIDECSELSFSLILLNSNNVSVIMVEIYHNGYKYKEDVCNDFSELTEVLPDNIENLYNIITKNN